MSSNVITYREGTQPQRIYAFLRGQSNHLRVNYWDGTQWKWADQGTPPSTTVDGVPGVITYLEGDKQRIYAFVRGQNGHLYVNYWDGTQWKWADRGTPPGTTVALAMPGVITYLEADKQRIYAFAGGQNGHLYVNYWDGAQWKWADQGTPPSTTIRGGPGVIAYLEGGTQRIYAFVRGQNGHLYVNYWDGTQWKWADRGTPPGTTTGGALEVQSPGVITYLEAAKQRIYAFVEGENHDLYVNYWDGTQWKWANQSPTTGVGAEVWGESQVVTYLEGSKQRIYAFIRSIDLRLLLNYWDGTQWKWANQGAFSGNILGPYGVVTYLEAGKQRIYAFAGVDTGHLVVNYWDGTQWKWADQGAP